MEALWLLRELGVVVERSDVFQDEMRLLKVYEPATTSPPFWATPKAVCALGELALDNDDNSEG